MKVASLFSGYGGLEMAACPFFDAETAWHSEIDPGACVILNHHWPHVPNLGDITRIDWAQVEPVDILTGGWPCQPFSHAGKRLGASDERALWPYVAGAVRALRPRHVVLENVAAIASAGELARAVGDLSALGYDAQWCCLRAADVGAPHERARIFIFATDTTAADPASNGWHEGRPEPARLVGGPDATERGDAAAHTNGDGQQGVRRLQPVGRDLDGRSSQDAAWGPYEPAATADADGSASARLADAPQQGPNGRTAAHGDSLSSVSWGPYEPAIRRWERVLGRPAPAPTETSRNGGQRLSPAFVEWMQGLPAGHVTGVPGLGRNAQLKALGNGVVPQQAYEALRRMAAA